MTGRLPLFRVDVTDADIEAVAASLRSGWLTNGPEVEGFEKDLAKAVGARYVVAVSSGTAALHLSLRGLGVGPGDDVLVPSFTFVATVNAILLAGARPVFVDVEPGVLTMDVEDVKRKVTRRTRMVLPVDVFGHPADHDAISDVAQERGFRVLADACEALGSEYRGRRVGTFGDAAAFSFFPNKTVTTGEGGAVTTADAEFADRLRRLRNHGKALGGSAPLEFGFHARMPDMVAALGRSQLTRLRHLLSVREGVARTYERRFREIPGVAPLPCKPDVRKAWFTFVIALDPDVPRDAFATAMATRGIETRAYFPPVHRMPYVVQTAGPSPSLPVTESWAARTLALPFDARMSEEEIETVASAAEEAIRDVSPRTATRKG